MSQIGITMGDPKGVGAELIAKAWKYIPSGIKGDFRIYGDRTILEAATKMVGGEIDPKQMVITSSIAGPVGDISEPDASRIAMLALDAAITDIKKNIISNAIICCSISIQ